MEKTTHPSPPRGREGGVKLDLGPPPSACRDPDMSQHHRDPTASATSGRSRTSEKRKKRDNRRHKGERPIDRPREYPSLPPHVEVGMGTRNPRDSGNTRITGSRARRMPRTAAIVMTCEGGSASYAEALRKAREKIPLAELNITDTRIRRAATSAIIIEIPGEGMRAKADLLASRMRDELRELGAKISRPTRTAEIMVYNFDDSVTDQDLTSALVQGSD